MTFEDTQKNDSSNATCDVLSTTQNHSLVTLPTSGAASTVVSIDQRHVTLVGHHGHLATSERNTSAPGNLDGVNHDQAQLVESRSNRDSAGVNHANEIPIVYASTCLNADTINPNPRSDSSCVADDLPTTDRSCSPEPYTFPGE